MRRPSASISTAPPAPDHRSRGSESAIMSMTTVEPRRRYDWSLSGAGSPSLPWSASAAASTCLAESRVSPRTLKYGGSVSRVESWVVLKFAPRPKSAHGPGWLVACIDASARMTAAMLNGNRIIWAHTRPTSLEQLAVSEFKLRKTRYQRAPGEASAPWDDRPPTTGRGVTRQPPRQSREQEHALERIDTLDRRRMRVRGRRGAERPPRDASRTPRLLSGRRRGAWRVAMTVAETTIMMNYRNHLTSAPERARCELFL